jgi:ketosteroid isomerase-like protein
MPDPLT